MSERGAAVRLEVHEEFPLRPGLAVRLINWLKRRRAVDAEIGVIFVFYREDDDRAPPARALAEVFANLLAALDPRPARVVVDRYLRLFGERTQESGHTVEQRGGTASFLTAGDPAELRWTLEEFDHEPPSILFGDAPPHPDAQTLHQLAGLLPGLHFLAEPALFKEHVALYFHTRERGDALLAAIERFCEEQGFDLQRPGG